MSPARRKPSPRPARKAEGTLRECPFCGAQARVMLVGLSETRVVVCPACGGAHNRAAWNRRAGSAAADGAAVVERIRAEVASERRAIQASIVGTVGGLVEGKPTSSLNYLQRLRELVRIEAQWKRHDAAAELRKLAREVREQAAYWKRRADADGTKIPRIRAVGLEDAAALAEAQADRLEKGGRRGR